MYNADSIGEQKAQLRKAIAEQKMQHSESLNRRSERCIQRLFALPRLLSAHVVVLYHSLADEVFTHDFADSLLAEGKRVLLPQVTGRDTMVLREYTGRQSMQRGAFGIMEPVGDVWTQMESVGLVLVPGVAFDRVGHRLGRGRGYYDRMLPSVPQAVKVGLCFDFQLVDEVPTTADDITMDVVVSESAVYVIGT